MNKWQEQYIKDKCGGQIPPLTQETEKAVELLGKMRDNVTVYIPDAVNAMGERIPAHKETFRITLTESDMLKGTMDAYLLGYNLVDWDNKGWKVETF